MNGNESRNLSGAGSVQEDLLILPQHIVLTSKLLSRALLSLTDIKGDKDILEKLIHVVDNIQILAEELYLQLIKLNNQSITKE